MTENKRSMPVTGQNKRAKIGENSEDFLLPEQQLPPELPHEVQTELAEDDPEDNGEVLILT